MSSPELYSTRSEVKRIFILANLLLKAEVKEPSMAYSGDSGTQSPEKKSVPFKMQ